MSFGRLPRVPLDKFLSHNHFPRRMGQSSMRVQYPSLDQRGRHKALLNRLSGHFLWRGLSRCDSVFASSPFMNSNSAAVLSQWVCFIAIGFPRNLKRAGTSEILGGVINQLFVSMQSVMSVWTIKASSNRVAFLQYMGLRVNITGFTNTACSD